MTSNMSVINETDSESLTPAEVVETAKTAIENLLPEKSKEKYTNVYNKFMDWRTKNKVKSFSENTLLTYFMEMSHNHKPTTLWANYSMLKTTLSINNDINIHNYKNLTAFLKRKSQGFQSKKSQVLTPEQIQKFLNEAPDDKYLDTKVAMIFGICGACRREELTQITINDIEDKGSILLVKIPKTKKYKPRSFVITDEFYSIFKKYITLRPKDVENSRFFLNYHNGRCTKQPIGLNKFGKIPRIIASYLKLPDPQSYTGHTFRRTSATLLADSRADIITLKRHGGWKSNTIAEGYVEDSFNNKKKVCSQITRSILNKPSTCTSQESEASINNPSTSNYTLNKEVVKPININSVNKENMQISNEELPETKMFQSHGCHTPTEASLFPYSLLSMIMDPLIWTVYHNMRLNGTTGEGMSMSVAERKLVAEAWAKATKEAKQHLMVQVGGASFPDVIELAKHASSLHVDSILCLPELYFKPTTPEQLIKYLETVGKAAPETPLLYYHIPVRTNVNIHMGQFLESIGDKIPSFVGIKFTSSNLEEGAQALRAANRKYTIFLGNNQLVNAAYALGMDSFILSSANMFPELVLELLTLCKKRDMLKAKDKQEQLSNSVAVIMKHNNQALMTKLAMHILTDINPGAPRAPPNMCVTPETDSKNLATLIQDLSDLGYEPRLIKCNIV